MFLLEEFTINSWVSCQIIVISLFLSMPVTTILVPGAAGPAGINTIKALKMAAFDGTIVATDSCPLAARFLMSSEHAVMPKAADETNFVEKLLQVVKSHNVQVLMPCSGYDIYPYSAHRKELENLGALPVVSTRDSLELCRDKLLTFQQLSGKFALPFTTADPDKVVDYPSIAKPRFSEGSRDVVKIDTEEDLRYVVGKYSEMVFQEFLPGMEYTVDVLSNLDQEPLLAVPRKRLQARAGISTKGQIIRDSELEEQCMRIAKSVGIVGPCCIQMKESKEGVPKLVKINPRMGGGTIFTILAGANFPKMIVDMVEGKPIVVPRISEITVIRYYEEIIVSGQLPFAESA